VKRYQALADDLEASIRKGVLRPGDRLPSVRTASTSRGVSASTVFQAYYLLEARGLVRARERSGYFVTEAARPLPPQPRQISQPAIASVRPEVDDLVFSILEAPVDPADVGLGSAFPTPLLYPFRQLGRALAAGAQDFDPTNVRDGMPPGNAQLLRHITARYHADGVPLGDGEIVVTNGALEALNLCLAALTRPGDSVIIECPSFYGALQSLERRGLQAVQVPTCPTRGIDIDALEVAIRRHKPKAAWLMTTFQNPLGCLMTPDDKRRLVGVLAHHGVPLIEDDVYQELFYGPQRPLPAKAYDEQGIVLHCSSFSKCLAPGYRVGWVAAGRHAAALRRQKLTLSILTAVPVQVGLARYLDQGGYERHLRRLRATLQKQRDAMGEVLCEHFPEGTEATRPQGGYFLWVKLPHGCDTLELHAQAAAHGIRFAPGPMFSATREFRDCLRLNYGREWTPATERAIATLGKLLRRPKLRVA
jgi:DNA-binding transcriptional MocR family regulator